MYAKKSFGQHFLRDQKVIDKIVAALDVDPDDVVIEVGPGTGALTERLLKKARRELVLIEADRDLLPDLHERFPKATLLHMDAATVDYAGLVGKRTWVFIGNLPYNAANAIIMQALTAPRPPKQLVIMVQREVGERMMARPGNMGILSVAVQLYAEVRRVCIVKPGAFVPPPKVDSVVLDLRTRPGDNTREKIIVLAKIGFGSRRKQLHRNLEDHGVAASEVIKQELIAMGLSPHARAEELSTENWRQLAQTLSPSV